MAFGFEHELRAEIARLRLTDAEREAVECGIELIREWHAGDDPKRRDATLRGLLERLGGQT